MTLVNVNQIAARTLVVQAGGYGEHQFTTASLDGKDVPVNAASLTVRLGPGAGARIVFKMRRYANQPRLAFPWDRN